MLVLLSTLAPPCAGDDNGPLAIEFSDKLPYGTQSVDYFAETVDDPVSRLQEQIRSGTVTLQSDDRHGYLKSLLKHLDVPVESQLLVFSKTARAPNLVSPKTPRAVFFNDTVSVAWIPEATELELTAVDPARGVNFYALPQPTRETSEDRPVEFARRSRCLACHSGRSSLEVPGLLLRGFQTDDAGKMLYGFSRITHDTTYDRRWGGWFVTGSPAGLIHRGNLIGESENERHKQEPGFLSSLKHLEERVDLSAWPTQSSDFVAHLILSHQVQGTNLLIRVGMEARLNRHSDAQDRLVRYLVFADEPELNISTADAIALRRTAYASWFQTHGGSVRSPGSLRELDLSRRLFRNRLSYLINTPLFDGLPEATRSELLTRIWHGLSDEQPEEAFRHLAAEERKQILSIVRATRQDVPAVWHSANR
ncbi:MAG: hypothetical protein O3C17_26645 [Planctomycetota bacterium]|nr:hypothetical protein [Planctomycetota bacterium]